jgi:hypothetical protein
MLGGKKTQSGSECKHNWSTHAVQNFSKLCGITIACVGGNKKILSLSVLASTQKINSWGIESCQTNLSSIYKYYTITGLLFIEFCISTTNWRFGCLILKILWMQEWLIFLLSVNYSDNNLEFIIQSFHLSISLFGEVKYMHAIVFDHCGQTQHWVRNSSLQSDGIFPRANIYDQHIIDAWFWNHYRHHSLCITKVISWIICWLLDTD